MAGNGKADQCHRELVEFKGPRKRGTIIFFPKLVILMRETGKQTSATNF